MVVVIYKGMSGPCPLIPFNLFKQGRLDLAQQALNNQAKDKVF